ncbi:MAG: malonic semialdehyde reductase [Proteobacteria bacterium]|nr:malonic semialdehyde reductase [Pseudomonadota bacterium]
MERAHPLPVAALEQLFLDARTYNRFTEREVDDATLHRMVDLMKWGPTAMNACPARFVFIKSAAAKARLGPALSPGNHDKTMAAPCVAIIAYDLEFYHRLPLLFPHVDGEALFANKPDDARAVAFRSGTLQAAYFILAARALGLDCGPMGGFDNAQVDATFFAGSSWRSNILVNLGYGDPASLRPRNARLAFDQCARIE